MTHEEFMKLPRDSRARIESAIIDLNKAVEDTFGISMFDRHTGVSDLQLKAQKPSIGDIEAQSEGRNSQV